MSPQPVNQNEKKVKKAIARIRKRMKEHMEEKKSHNTEWQMGKETRY